MTKKPEQRINENPLASLFGLDEPAVPEPAPAPVASAPKPTVPKKKKPPVKTTVQKKPAPKPVAVAVKEPDKSADSTATGGILTVTLDTTTIEILDNLIFDQELDSRGHALSLVFTTLRKITPSNLESAIQSASLSVSGPKLRIQLTSPHLFSEDLLYFRKLLRIRSRSELIRKLVHCYQEI